MKLNIQVELDWLDEEGNIEELVQEEIIAGVKNAISKDCLKLVEEKTQKAIDNGLSSAISAMDQKVSDFFENWLNNEAVITDQYGDPKEKGTLREIIKRKFDDCMNEKVDSDGEPSKYGRSCTRLEFVTGNKVKEMVDGYLSNYDREIDKSIKQAVEEGIKERVSDKFAQMVIGYATQDHENKKAIEHKS